MSQGTATAAAGAEPVERRGSGNTSTARGGDELNLSRCRVKLRLLLRLHGINYSGPADPRGCNGCLAPNSRLHYWRYRPASAVLYFMTGSARLAALKHHRRAGAKELIRLTLEGDKVVAEERLLGDRGERIREVRSGPDGYLYLLTDERDGKLLKVGAS
ncbi:PQQ-dependent sugar dehydrogenase [Serratia ureilytica]